MLNRMVSLGAVLLFVVVAATATGCKGLSVTEIRGKTSFGPEFRNFGNNTSDIRYTAIQGLVFKLSNDWTAGVSYQRRDLDDGAGDNENLVLFEIGYPLFKAPKKPEKSANAEQFEKLENELRQLNSELAQVDAGAASASLATVEESRVK